VRTYLKAVWHAEHPCEDLIASTGFAFLTPGWRAVPPFVGYVCQSEPFTDRVTAESVGVAYPAIAETKLRAFEVCVPPMAEQTAIARFLDHVTSRIDRYVRAKEKLITLLAEQKEALIHEAVTGRIDVRTGKPYPAYKDSGVEWLGDIPAHWRLVRNARLFQQRNESGHSALPILEVFLRSGVRVRNFTVSGRKQVMADREMYKRAVKGDVTYNTMRMWQGAVGAAPIDGLVSPAYVVARPLPGTQSQYFEHLFRTHDYMRHVNRHSRGIVKDRNRLYWEDFKQMASLCPPTNEQALIADAIRRDAKRIGSGIGNARRQIGSANEYRTRLIADVVTGKLDVREAAAGSSGVEPTQAAGLSQ